MIYDVSVPITNTMPVWPSDPAVHLETQSHLSRDQSHSIRVTRIDMGSHTGTHIDAPFHFIESGRTLNQIPLDTLIGPALVFEIPAVHSIGVNDVAGVPSGVERILFKTENSKHWNDGRFFEEFVYLEPEAAQVLVDHGVKVVGIDYLSIDKYKSEKHPSHFVLLGRDVVIIEGLNLSKVTPGPYRMVALPLNLQGVDGAPTRVILTEI